MKAGGADRVARGREPPDQRPGVLRPAPPAAVHRADGRGASHRRTRPARDRRPTEYLVQDERGGTFGPIAGPDQRPGGPARTVNVNGKSVPYVVRVERGVINRSPYSFAVLDDPSGWNQRLVYQFGGGCGTAYSQGSPLGTNVVDDALLIEGLRGRDRELQHVPDVVQRRALGRDRDDGQGARGRDDRRAAVHDRRRRVGWRDPAADDRPELPGHPRRALAGDPVPRRDLGRAGRLGLRAARALLREPRARASPTAQRAAINGHRTIGTCRAVDLVVPRHDRPDDRLRPADPGGPDLLRRRTRRASAARCRTSTATSSASTRRPGSRTGRSTTSACSTGCRRSTRGRSPSTSSSTSTRRSAATTSTASSSPSASRPRRPRSAARTRPGGCSPAAAACATSRSSRSTSTATRTATSTTGSGSSRFASGCASKNGKVDRNEVIWTRPSNGDIAAGAHRERVRPGRRGRAARPLAHRRASGPQEAVDNCTDATGKLVSGPHIYDEPGPCRDLYPVFGDPRTAAGAPLINDRLKCQRPAGRPEEVQGDVHAAAGRPAAPDLPDRRLRLDASPASARSRSPPPGSTTASPPSLATK